MVQEWRFKVSGEVQGVFFRANTHMSAVKLGLTGYVGNEPDGTVSVLAQGAEEKLQQLYEFLKSGPENAKVKNVEVSKSDKNTEIHQDFEVR